MVFKFWNLHQFVPTCFHLLSNGKSHVSLSKTYDYQIPNNLNRPNARQQKKRLIKIITPNGIVLVYTKPIRASKLMTEFPTHLLCRSDSFIIGKKIPSLNPKTKLKRGDNYFLLPKPYFQSTLTFASAAASFASAQPGGICSSKLANSCNAFSIEKASNGGLKISVSDEFIAQLSSEQRKTTSHLMIGAEKKERVCNTPQLMKDYAQLVGSSRQWRPKLETIKEKRKFKAFRRKKGSKTWKGIVLNQMHQARMSSPRMKVAKFRRW